LTAFDNILDYYKINKWTITHIVTDHEANFTATHKQLQQLGVQLTQNSPEHHSRAAERAIRTIKNLARTTYLALPYTLPSLLYRNLITYVTERYNVLPQMDGDHLSPRQRITGQRPHYNQDIKAVFGDIVLCPVPTHLQRHDLGERGEIGIIVGNPFNKHGVCVIYIPTRKSLCHRTNFKTINIDNSIRNLISTIPKDLDFLKDPAFPLQHHIITNEDDQQTSTTITTNTINKNNLTMNYDSSPASNITLTKTFQPNIVNNNMNQKTKSIKEVLKDSPFNLQSTQVNNNLLLNNNNTKQNTCSPINTKTNSSKPININSFQHQQHDSNTSNKKTTNIGSRPDNDNLIDTHLSQSDIIMESIPPLNHETLILNNNDQIVTNDRTISLALPTIIERRDSDGSIPRLAQEAMKDEIKNVLKYQTWIPIPANQHVDEVIRSLMIAVEKFTAAGVFDKWKGRLAAMGNQLGFDPSLQISSPTLDLASLFLMLALVNHTGDNLESFDVPSAYLNTDLLEDVYMMLDKIISAILIEIDPTYRPFLRKDGTILVKLKKSLYGLRQAGANWYKMVSQSLIQLGYTVAHTDSCLFSKREGCYYSIVGLYVDDCLYFGNNPQ